MQVKEGFTPLAFHHSECHYDGTCADVGFAQPDYTPAQIHKVFEISKKYPDLSVMWENPNPAEFGRMRAAYKEYLMSIGMSPADAAAKMEKDLHSFSWATAPHFHIHCEDCERSGAALNPLAKEVIASNNNEPLFEKTGS